MHPFLSTQKYGVRAFRYCSLDLGHAMAAVSISAALMGWQVSPVDGVSTSRLATLLGFDRDDGDYEGERERAEVLLRVTINRSEAKRGDDSQLIARLPPFRYYHEANKLSRSHYPWPSIDRVAAATEYKPPAHPGVTPSHVGVRPGIAEQARVSGEPAAVEVIRSRRTAVAFAKDTKLNFQAFIDMMRKLLPPAESVTTAPWGTMGRGFGGGAAEAPFLGIFVHRVKDLSPGQYVLVRSGSVSLLKERMKPHFVWSRVVSDLELFLLEKRDTKAAAQEVSCNQEIAQDSFFTLGCFSDIADLSQLSDGKGIDPNRYRRKHWECGIVGHMLYLHATALGFGATGIGCFNDEPMRKLWMRKNYLGEESGSESRQEASANDPDFMPLYHVAVGAPVIDNRIKTERPYSKLK